MVVPILVLPIFTYRKKNKMKYIKQFLVIIAISLVGELLHYLLPLSVPASIYGMVIMFAGLMTGPIKLDAVKDAGKVMIEIMPVMFIPAGVGLMASWGVLKPMIVPVSIITVVTVVAVMAASGRISQTIIRMDRKKKERSADNE